MNGIDQLLQTLTVSELQIKAVELQKQAQKQDQDLQREVDQNIRQFTQGFDPLNQLLGNLTQVQENLLTQFTYCRETEAKLAEVNGKLRLQKTKLRDSILQKKKRDQVEKLKQLPQFLASGPSLAEV